MADTTNSWLIFQLKIDDVNLEMLKFINSRVTAILIKNSKEHIYIYLYSVAE